MLGYRARNVYKHGYPLISRNIFILWNLISILVALPLLNFLVVPCIPSSTMRERIGFGVAFITLSSVIAAFLEWCVVHDMSQGLQLLWLLIPSVCLSFGEVLLFVTGKFKNRPHNILVSNNTLFSCK